MKRYVGEKKFEGYVVFDVKLSLYALVCKGARVWVLPRFGAGENAGN